MSIGTVVTSRASCTLTTRLPLCFIYALLAVTKYLPNANTSFFEPKVNPSKDNTLEVDETAWGIKAGFLL